MKCKLCGYQFDIKQAVQSCASCPLTKNCPLVRCPNCNYEWPLDSEESNKLVPLTSLKKGEKGKISTICTSQTEYLKKIISMGIMPGMTIEMIRRFPTLLCQIGFSQFALDDEIAKYILVSRIN
ncbi:hypothetical protein COY16_04015 [Candidatus Roizmanbacteria bacterium CG_4_10_14_0_2_um_filter_39_13]|uniref:Ferrous iron transporter FeoA-like domain-containing protein n=1 Tax=Candidatus Roizmanbacteria bacterium CG_4_10_14_0_2_um_filter_39_13 TaxID=1974825 RepID=A0A2M7TXL1_9BACT|nr:MAG: hypothetical protein COY16_04015 [Candidatus Roizmanbacteria bacterium CG_4_10_14_0_2_um_filter_39_13]